MYLERLEEKIIEKLSKNNKIEKNDYLKIKPKKNSLQALPESIKNIDTWSRSGAKGIKYTTKF